MNEARHPDTGSRLVGVGIYQTTVRYVVRHTSSPLREVKRLVACDPAKRCVSCHDQMGAALGFAPGPGQRSSN
jgi:hypothetical protein